MGVIWATWLAMAMPVVVSVVKPGMVTARVKGPAGMPERVKVPSAAEVVCGGDGAGGGLREGDAGVGDDGAVAIEDRAADGGGLLLLRGGLGLGGFGQIGEKNGVLGERGSGGAKERADDRGEPV